MSDRSDAVLTLTNIYRVFARERHPETTLAVRDFNLEVKYKEMVALYGPPNSGKSTVLGIAGLLLRPTSGEVLLHGHEVPQTEPERAAIRNSALGFIFHDYDVIEWMSVLDNVAMALDYESPRVPHPQRQQRAKVELERLEIPRELFSRPAGEAPAELRLRIALARALVTNPDLILADEPTTGLDDQATMRTMSLLKALSEFGVSVLVATDREQVARFADRIVPIASS